LSSSGAVPLAHEPVPVTYMDYIKSISVKEYHAWKPCLKVIVHETPRRFGAIIQVNGAGNAALSWRSDNVEPVVLRNSASSLWVGVDQRVVCITPEPAVLFSLGLNGNFLNIHCFPTVVAVLCDTEVILINEDYSIRNICAMKEIPKSINSVGNNQLFVTYDDNTTELISADGS
jgi:hypothetical protein